MAEKKSFFDDYPDMAPKSSSGKFFDDYPDMKPSSADIESAKNKLRLNEASGGQSVSAAPSETEASFSPEFLRSETGHLQHGFTMPLAGAAQFLAKTITPNSRFPKEIDRFISEKQALFNSANRLPQEEGESDPFAKDRMVDVSQIAGGVGAYMLPGGAAKGIVKALPYGAKALEAIAKLPTWIQGAIGGLTSSPMQPVVSPEKQKNYFDAKKGQAFGDTVIGAGIGGLLGTITRAGSPQMKPALEPAVQEAADRIGLKLLPGQRIDSGWVRGMDVAAREMPVIGAEIDKISKNNQPKLNSFVTDLMDLKTNKIDKQFFEKLDAVENSLFTPVHQVKTIPLGEHTLSAVMNIKQDQARSAAFTNKKIEELMSKTYDSIFGPMFGDTGKYGPMQHMSGKTWHKIQSDLGRESVDPSLPLLHREALMKIRDGMRRDAQEYLPPEIYRAMIMGDDLTKARIILNKSGVVKEGNLDPKALKSEYEKGGYQFDNENIKRTFDDLSATAPLYRTGKEGHSIPRPLANSGATAFATGAAYFNPALLAGFPLAKYGGRLWANSAEYLEKGGINLKPVAKKIAGPLAGGSAELLRGRGDPIGFETPKKEEEDKNAWKK